MLTWSSLSYLLALLHELHCPLKKRLGLSRTFSLCLFCVVVPEDKKVPLPSVQQLRAKLRAGEASIGSWMQLPDSSVAELMGAAGYDWVAIDLEHGRYAEDRLPDIFRAIEAGGTLPFARLGQVNAYTIKAALDAGAQGLIFPMVESAEQIHQAISWSHYPPRGRRGVGYSRANLFGKAFDEYRNCINPFLVAQIEHKEAALGIEAILTVEGLDAIMIGPYDLSASMGLTGQFDHPEFKELLERVIAACDKRSMPVGQHVVTPDLHRLETALAEGYRFVAYCTDAVFLWHGASRRDMAS